MNRKHSVKEVSALSAKLLGDFDPHQSEFEQLADDIGPQFARLVHLPHVRRYFAFCEFDYGVKEQGLVFAEDRKWL